MICALKNHQNSQSYNWKLLCEDMAEANVFEEGLALIFGSQLCLLSCVCCALEYCICWSCPSLYDEHVTRENFVSCGKISESTNSPDVIVRLLLVPLRIPRSPHEVS